MSLQDQTSHSYTIQIAAGTLAEAYKAWQVFRSRMPRMDLRWLLGRKAGKRNLKSKVSIPGTATSTSPDARVTTPPHKWPKRAAPIKSGLPVTAPGGSPKAKGDYLYFPLQTKADFCRPEKYFSDILLPTWIRTVPHSCSGSPLFCRACRGQMSARPDSFIAYLDPHYHH